LQEDLKKDPISILKDIHSFIDVDKNFKTDTSINHNESGIPNNFFSKFLLSRNNIFSTFIREIMKRVFSRPLLEKISSKSLQKIAISEDDRVFLKPYFNSDICKLEKLLNRDLSSWK